MKMNKLCTAMLVAGAFSASASAATIGQITSLYPSFQWEDDNSEQIVNRVGTDPYVLDVGDSLRGIIEITKIINVANPSQFQLLSIGTTSTGNSSLAAVFEIEVLSKTVSATQNAAVPGTEYDYVFGPNAAFGASIGVAGTMVAWYDDSVANVARTGCTAGAGGTCEGSVTDGTLILALGLGTDPDTIWTTTSTPENTNLSTLSSASKFGSFNYSLDVLMSSIGDFAENQASVYGALGGGNGLVKWIGSGDVLGGLGYAPYTSTSDADLTANRIPEPGTMALLGLGLFGIGALRRRGKV